MDFESMVCMSLLLVRAKRQAVDNRSHGNSRQTKGSHGQCNEKFENSQNYNSTNDISSPIVPAKKRLKKYDSIEDIDEEMECAEELIESGVKCELKTEDKKGKTTLVRAKSEFHVYIDEKNEHVLHEEYNIEDVVKNEEDETTEQDEDETKRDEDETNEDEDNAKQDEDNTKQDEDETNKDKDNTKQDENKKSSTSKVRAVTSYKNHESLTYGHFQTLHCKLKETPEFYEYYRMSIKTFEELLSILRPRISHKVTNMRKPVTPEMRLSVTLRYLSTGNGCHMLSKDYLLGSSTICKIIRETCREICNALKEDYFPPKNKESWLKIAKEFYDVTSFPNCIGAIEGKQLRVKVPVTPDRQKKWSSTLVLGVVDASYCFIDIDIINDLSGEDGNIFNNSNIGKKLYAGKLNIPKLRRLPNDENGSEMPFIFVGDESLAVSGNVLRPFPKRDLDIARSTFNERLSKVRQMSSRAFDILVGKWTILNHSIFSKPENMEEIVKSVCLLHNFVMKRDFDIISKENFHRCRLKGSPSFGTRGTFVGKEIRDYFVNYFTVPHK